MRKKFRSQDILEELEPKEKSPIIPIIIFLSVVAVLSVITVTVFNVVTELIEVEMPWTGDENKEENKKKPTSSRDQMDLVVPSLNTSQTPKNILKSELEVTKIKADEYGYLITISLKTLQYKYTTIEVKQITLDNFYFTTTFALSDPLDYNENGEKAEEQQATTYEFRIKQTELDDIGMFGFNQLKLIFDIENNELVNTDQEYYLTVNNDLNIVNKRNGLIRIDKKNDVVVSYYKTITSADGTYIYFDFLNENYDKDIDVYVKQIIINNKIYDLSDFKGVSPRQSQRSLYLLIPSKDIPYITTMKVQFFLVEENKTTKEKSFYITNEYARAY